MTHLVEVAGARDLGPQFTQNPYRMVGQDGAYSIPLGGGESFWFFGDTLIGARVEGESLWFPGGEQLGPDDMSGHGSIERMLNNTGLILPDGNASAGLRDFQYITDATGRMRQLIPHSVDEHPDEIRVWCLHGIHIEDSLYLYYLTVRMKADGPMPVNFDLVGAGLAVGSMSNMRFRRIPTQAGMLWWPAPLPQFGTTVLHAREEKRLYIYGVRKADDGTQCCCLARVDERGIASHEAYEYYGGPGAGWTNDPRHAATIMTGMPNEMSVSWNEHLGSYLAVHSLDLSGRIVARTAPAPWGPWSEPVDLWQVVPPALSYKPPYPPLIYAGKEHPELSPDGGRTLYITYIEFEEYFPHLVEVSLR